MPTVGFHASHELEALIKERAAAKKLRVSTYLTPIVESAVRGDGIRRSPETIMQDLAKEFCGEGPARKMAALVKDRDQIDELASLLHLYIANANEGFAPKSWSSQLAVFLTAMAGARKQAARRAMPPGPP